MIRKLFTFSGHEAPVYALEAFEDGKLFSGGGDKIITSIKTGEVPEVIGLVNTSATIYSLKFLPVKRILLAGTMSGGIHVIDLFNKKEVKLLAGHTAGIFDLKYSPLNNIFISASGDGSVGFWSADEYSLIKSVHLCNEKVRCIAISHDESFVAIGCGDGQIRLVDFKNFELIKEFPAHNLSVNAIVFHPYQNVLLTGGRDAHLNIWDNEWRLIKSIPAHNYAIYSICFSTNGKIFFTGSRDKTIKVWDADNFGFKEKLDKGTSDGHAHSVNKIIMMDNLLISCGDDKKVMGWSTEEQSI